MTRNFWRNSSAMLLPLMIFGFLALLTFWLNRAVELSAPVRDRVLTHDPDYAVEKFVMTRLGETGEARYKIAGDRLLHYPDDETSHLKNPVLTRLDVEAPPMRVNADRGLITADGSDVYLNGNVVLFRPADPARPAYRDFLRISSSYMHVLPDADRATSPKPVLIENGASTLRGTGMDFDARYRTLNVKSTVTAQYVQRPAPQKKTQR